jgi:hypothetical protein
MQSAMMLLIDLGDQIIKTEFARSQWIHPADRVLVQAIPAPVFWSYIHQHQPQTLNQFGQKLQQILGLQLPLVLVYIRLIRWRKWQRYFTLMLWAWPIATPWVALSIYRSQSSQVQKVLRYLGLFFTLIALSFFTAQPQTALQAIWHLISFLVAAIWFSISGIIFACIHTITVLSGNIGMDGEMDREGLSYGLAAIGYFELFWLSLFLKHNRNNF